MTAATLKWVPGKPKLAYECVGSGPAVIFLHGIGGNRGSWTNQVAALKGSFATITWDARGYGSSQDTEGPLEFGSFADDLARMMDHLELNRAHLVGLSMGGRILLDFQQRYASRIATLTLCDTHFGFETALTPEKREEFIRLRQKPLLEGKSFAELAPQLIDSLVSPDCSQNARKTLNNSILALRRDSYLKTIEASVQFEASASLSNIKVPVQLIYGEHDRLTAPSIGEKMLKQMHNARLAIIPAAGHLSNIEQPQAFNRVLRKFLDQHAELAETLKE